MHKKRKTYTPTCVSAQNLRGKEKFCFCLNIFSQKSEGSKGSLNYQTHEDVYGDEYTGIWPKIPGFRISVARRGGGGGGAEQIPKNRQNRKISKIAKITKNHQNRKNFRLRRPEKCTKNAKPTRLRV